MKESKGTDRVADSVGYDMNRCDESSINERHYNSLVVLSRVSAAIRGLQNLDRILRIGLDIEIHSKSGNQDPQLFAGLKKVQALTVQVHKEVSRVIFNLHHTVLDTLGLVAAVRQHAKNTLQPLSINVTVKVQGTEKRFLPDVETALFRFVQGSIGNIVNHSRAKNASIVLVYKPEEFSLTVSDDGQGFDVSGLTYVEDSGRARGLFSMRERIGSLAAAAAKGRA